MELQLALKELHITSGTSRGNVRRMSSMSSVTCVMTEELRTPF